MNPEIFYGIIRENLFRGKLTQGVVDTLGSIVDTYYAHYMPTADPEHLAYILATAYHESYHRSKNPDWNPVREGFAKSNEAAIAVVTKMYEQGRINHNYSLPHTNGRSYYGRGHVQCTWPENYRKMGRLLNMPLYENPDLMLDPIVSAKALVIGSVEGVYTGRKLSDYDTPDDMLDAFNARRVINGLDKAEKIKGDYEIFHFAINSAINAV